jgi:predicted nuclease with TOPRIM domain
VEKAQELEQSKAKEACDNTQQLAKLQHDMKRLKTAAQAQVKQGVELKARVTTLEAELLEVKKARDELQAEKTVLEVEVSRLQESGKRLEKWEAENFKGFQGV